MERDEDRKGNKNEGREREKVRRQEEKKGRREKVAQFCQVTINRCEHATTGIM